MRYVKWHTIYATILLCTVANHLAQCDEFKPVPDPISDRIIDIRLPVVPVTVEPDAPVPAPSPVVPGTDPQLVKDIVDGELYVIEHSAKLIVASSRDGHVTVTTKKGPLSLYARFVDGVDRNEYEERTYSAPFIYIVKAVKTGETELLIFSGVDVPIVRNVLTVTVGPRPPPGPTPPGPTPPGPTPPGPTPPEPVTSFRVIFVKESGSTLNSAQTAIPGAKAIRDYLTSKTTPEGGLAGWREYDPQQSTVNEQPTMKKLWEAVQSKLLPAPCLVIEVNGTATVMPFPANVSEALDTLKKAGG